MTLAEFQDHSSVKQKLVSPIKLKPFLIVSDAHEITIKHSVWKKRTIFKGVKKTTIFYTTEEKHTKKQT